MKNSFTVARSKKSSFILAILMLTSFILSAIPAGASAAKEGFGISLSQSGTYTFPSVMEKYSTQTPLSVTVTNTGSVATGSLKVTLSGENAGAFTRTSSISSITAPGGTATFTVRPNNNLAPGTYKAIVSVSNANTGDHSFNISFTVTEGSYGISLSQTNAYTFPSAKEKYTAQTALSVTVSNTGDIATGKLNITLSGENANAFSTSSSSMLNLNTGTNKSFTVRPVTGLKKGIYKATITISNANVGSRSFDISFMVSDTTFGISLDQTGEYSFPSAPEQYATQKALVLTVNNTGDQKTGNLKVALSGSGASAFTASSSVSSIAVGASRTISIRPKNDLKTGTYKATLTVSNQEVESKSLEINFTVTNANFALSLFAGGIVDGQYIFPSAVEKYSNQKAFSISVINNGNQTTGALKASLSGESASAFTLSATSLSSIAVDKNRTLSIRPKTGLAAGTYKATVTISNANIGSKSIDVIFTVTTVKYDFSLYTPGIVEGKYTFPSAVEKYGNQKALSVKIINNSNQVTGAVNVVLSGENADAFTISSARVSSINAGGNRSFTVRPKTGLASGTYAAVLTVFNDNVGTRTFDISFTVTKVRFDMFLFAAGAVENKYIFSSAAENYSAPKALSVKATNSGNQATGILAVALSGENPEAFITSAGELSTIATGKDRTFTVRPKTGLKAGTYTSTVTVFNDNVGTRMFDISFTVKN